MRFLAGLILAACASAGTAHAQARAFAKEDYVRYFAPGRFESFSPYYESHGVLDMVENRPIAMGGLYVVHQRARSLDVSRNYDVWSDYPFYKIKSEGEDKMVWNRQLGAMLADFDGEEFDSDDSYVWESSNERTEISPEDVDGGLLHDFYWRADKRAGRDPEETRTQYRQDVTGPWIIKCSYLVRQEYEVECVHSHEATGRNERYLYRKLGLTS